MTTEDAAARLYRLTRHGTDDPERADTLVRFRPLDPTNRPDPFRRFPGAPVEALPHADVRAGPPAGRVLAGAVPATRPGLDAGDLARLLFLGAGVTRVAERGPGEATYFRAAMSAGNLHPVEVYVVAGSLSGVAAGVHHFDPLEVALRTLRPGDHRGALAAAAAEPAVAEAPVTLVLTGLPWRTGWKYGERGWRHLYWDAGTQLANLLAAATAAGVSARVLAAFVDDDVAALVGADGVEELPLALVPLGHDGPAAPRDPAEDGIAQLAARPVPVARAPIEFPLVREAQHAGDLGEAAAVERWRARAGAAGGAPAAAPSGPGPAGDASIGEVVLQRGSTRVMRHAEIDDRDLRWMLEVAASPVPGDWLAARTTWLEHALTAPAVRGLDPGAYRRHPDGRLEPLHRAGRDAVREAGRRLCLDQPLGGDAAFTVFHLAAAAPLSGLGARAYRAAQLEAGIASERLALAAFALDLGATGLTFYDEAVRQVFRTDAVPMLVTAVGVPDYRNRPGGTPGAPTRLAGYDELMRRLSIGLQRSRR